MAVSLLASNLWLAWSAVGSSLGASDPVPKDDDVTAGWIAAFVFGFLILAVVLLGRSFVKQLRKAQAAREAGVYGDPPTTPQGPDAPGQRPTGQRPDAASR